MAYRYRVKQYHDRVTQHLKEIGGDIDVTKLPEEWRDHKSVADLLPDPTKYGDYVKVSEIEGGPIMIRRIGDWSGTGDPSMSSGAALLVNADLVGGEKVWFIVSHVVLYRKLNDLRDRIPFVATFFRVDKKRYYDVK